MAGFEIIPVIDLMGGVVVHAKAGERDRYQPLVSRLARSSEPLDVVRSLLDLHPFRSLYIADLDAIRKQGAHVATVRDLRDKVPNLTLWIDAGFAADCTCRKFLKGGLGHLVLGSESQADADLLEALAGETGLILSLDFKGGARLGPAAIFERTELWPQRVIVMTLAAVGGSGGPDLRRLRKVLALAGPRQVYAAGGVRGREDLAALRELGCAGVLVASALHDRRLTQSDLAAFA